MKFYFTNQQMLFPYTTIQKEYINCNFCDGNSHRILSNGGTDGLAITSVICKKCSLIFINPRMSKEDYRFYYEEEYREKTINHGENGSGFDCQKLFESTINHGKALSDMIKPYIEREGSIMEIGSGVGGVLEGIRRTLNRTVIGLEPSLKESDYANSRGIKTYHSLMEDFSGKEKNAVILSTQSLNHLLDPKYFFAWSHESLVDDGILVIEVMNFRQQLQKAGKYKNAVKIDHVYMFTPEVLRDFIESAGFKIVFFDADEYTTKERVQGVPHVHIRIIGKKIKGKPFEKLTITSGSYFFTAVSINRYLIYFKYILNKLL